MKKKPAFHASAARLHSMVESAPVNIMCADKHGTIEYLNPKSIETLKTLQALLPLQVDDIQGGSFDVFHANPAYQRDFIKDASRLPMTSRIQVGDETLDLLITAMLDDSGAYLGPMVTWELISADLERQDEMARVNSMMEGAPINIMCADTKGVIQYLNPASLETLQGMQSSLPLSVAEITGHSFDIFHSRPAHQRDVVKDDSKLPMSAQIQVGDETLDLLVSPMRNANGEYIGPMVTWERITERLATERAHAEMEARERSQARELRDKVDNMLAVVAAAAEGDLTGQISFEGDDAISQMADGLTSLLVGLRESIAGIADNARTLASASESLIGVSQDLSASSEETSVQATVVSQASKTVDENVQTVAAGTEELSASIREISGNAHTAADVAREGVQVAEETNAKISHLSFSSAEIGKVIKAITSIAQQTNLLALNATIEAARAGEAGKGFAVVANEVKELAKATAQATEDINNKILAIQSDTIESVNSIEKFSEIILTINETQNSIASAVEEQASVTSDMAKNVSNAHDSTAAIVSNIEGVADAAGETSKSAAGVMSAAGDLSSMASTLEQLVARFTY